MFVCLNNNTAADPQSNEEGEGLECQEKFSEVHEFFCPSPMTGRERGGRRGEKEGEKGKEKERRKGERGEGREEGPRKEERKREKKKIRGRGLNPDLGVGSQ